MNIVVLDKSRLPDGVEFPFLQATKYGWVERTQVEEEEIAEVAWRSHVVVTVETPIPSAILERLPLLQLVVVVGSYHQSLIDLEQAKARGVMVTDTSPGEVDSMAGAQVCCDRAVEIIDAMIAGESVTPVSGDV